MLVGFGAAAGYAAYLFLQPACGAPGNTTPGQSNRYVPWALLTTEVVVVALVGKLLRRRAPTIIGGVLLGSVLAAAAAVILFLVWFGSGNCGE